MVDFPKVIRKQYDMVIETGQTRVALNPDFRTISQAKLNNTPLPVVIVDVKGKKFLDLSSYKNPSGILSIWVDTKEGEI